MYILVPLVMCNRSGATEIPLNLQCYVSIYICLLCLLRFNFVQKAALPPRHAKLVARKTIEVCVHSIDDCHIAN